MTGIISSMQNLSKMVSQIMERRKTIGMKSFIVEWEVKVLIIPNNQEVLKKGHRTIEINHNNLKSKLNGVRNYSRRLS